MISAFGMYVAVGIMAWAAEGASCFGSGCGLGMSTTAQLDGAGVPGSAQLERRRAHTIRAKKVRGGWFTILSGIWHMNENCSHHQLVEFPGSKNDGTSFHF
jgi:hypothetical protein